MAITTTTLTGRFRRASSSIGVGGKLTLSVLSSDGTIQDPATGDILVSTDSYTVPGTGQVSWSGIPSIPQAGIEPSDARYRLSFESNDKRDGFRWDVVIDTLPSGTVYLDDLVDVDGIPVTPTVLQQAEAARDAAANSASTANVKASAAATSAAAAEASAGEAFGYKATAQTAATQAAALVVSDLGTSDGQMDALIQGPSNARDRLISNFARGVSAAKYGATGNGTTDDTAAIQSAIDAVSALNLAGLAKGEGGFIHLPPGTYKITSPLTINTKGIQLVGFGGATIDGSSMAASATLSDKFAIKASGSIGSSVPITADLAAGATTVTTTTAGLAAGDMVLITSNQNYTDGASGTYGNRGALHRIKSITNGTTLELTEPSFFAYAAASSATIQKVAPLEGLVIENVKIRMGGATKSHCGIQVNYAYMPLLRRVTIDGCEDTGIEIRNTWGGAVEHPSIQNATSGSLGTSGYGVCLIEANRNVRVGPGGDFNNCRHAVTGGGDIVSIHIRVTGNTASNCTAAAYDCHEECWWWEFDGNTAIGGSVGFGIRGQATTIRGNHGYNTGSHGIHVKNYDVNTDGLIGPNVTGNTMIGCGGGGIQWEGTADCRIKGGEIVGNTLRRNKFNNIQVQLSDYLSIGHNEYDTTYGSGGGDGNNIRLVGSSASSRCTNISVQGGTFKGSENRWIRADFADYLTISNPTVFTSGANNTHLVSCTNTRLVNPVGAGVPALIQTVTSNADFNLTPMISSEDVFHTGTLTANRTITLLTTNAYVGARFRVTRTGGGAFNLNVGTGPLKALATNTWAEVRYDGTAWAIIASGTV